MNTRPEVRDFLRGRDAIIASRDALVSPGTPRVVAAIAQRQSAWGALEDVCAALEQRGTRVEVVAIDSGEDIRRTSTGEFLADRGRRPRDAGWLEHMLTDGASGLSAMLFSDPWDGQRPWPATAQGAAEHGVRIAYLPYSPNAAAGEHLHRLSYDQPMHRLAWRIYVLTPTQRELFGRHCAVGADHVRALGSPKLDRCHAAARPDLAEREDTPRRRILWNPHFRLERGGWSTLETYLGPLLEYTYAHPEIELVVRPHFLLRTYWPRHHDMIVRAGDLLPNVRLDLEADYLPSFVWAEAMISDLSSLVTEFMVTGKPLLYLHREDGPGLNEDAWYFLGGDVATSWSDVEAFLDRMRTGTDSGSTRRRLATAMALPYIGDSARRIADDIVGSLRTEMTRARPGDNVSLGHIAPHHAGHTG